MLARVLGVRLLARLVLRTVVIMIVMRVVVRVFHTTMRVVHITRLTEPFAFPYRADFTSASDLPGPHPARGREGKRASLYRFTYCSMLPQRGIDFPKYGLLIFFEVCTQSPSSFGTIGQCAW